MKILLFVLFTLFPYIAGAQVIVPMEKQPNGLYLIPCEVNGVPMKFIFDTGASVVNISMTEAIFLYKNGYIKESDIMGNSQARIANGEIVENTRILLNKIDIGGIEIKDVEATVTHNLNAPLLLGQSAISKLGSLQLDGNKLIIRGHGDAQIVDNEKNRCHHNLMFWMGTIVLVAVFFLLSCYFISRFRKHKNLKAENIEDKHSKGQHYIWYMVPVRWIEKRKYIVFVLYCFTLLLSLLIIELHINNKRDRLFSDMIQQMKNSVISSNGDDYVEALDNESIDDLEYVEVPIPSFNENDSKTKRKQWNIMFSGIDHLYKITDGGWQMIGMSFQLVRYNELLYKYGIQDFFYSPYMICVPNGKEFNSDIAKLIVKKSLDKVYSNPDDFNVAQEVLSLSNDYFHIVGHSTDNSIPEQIHFYNETTGTDPIFENGKFTGRYWYGMHKIGPYRVLLQYSNRIAWKTEEKEGFKASLKDRIIYYGIVFAILTSLLCLFLRSMKHKIKMKK